jgi:hypothetical protein
MTLTTRISTLFFILMIVAGFSSVAAAQVTTDCTPNAAGGQTCTSVAVAGKPSPPVIQVSGGTGGTGAYTVRGQAVPGATVAISTPSGAKCPDNTQADANGAFTCTLSGTPANGESISAQQTAPDGQKSDVGETPNAIKQLPDTEANRAFLKDGVFGCGTGAYAMNVGTMNAIGGVYVPVNDAAVTQNTGYLVYKFCILDGVVVREREAATSAFVKAALDKITGKGGTPAYVLNIQEYIREKQDKTMVEFTKNYNFNAACTPYRDPVKRAIVQQYLQTRNKKNASFTCTLPNGTASAGVGALWQIAQNPGGNTPLGAYMAAQIQAEEALSETEDDVRDEVQRNNGFKDVVRDDTSPTETGEQRVIPRVLTPGSVIKAITDQMVTSGYRQLENASAVDQIINALFSGLSTQILTDAGGLAGISQQQGATPSYLNQASQNAVSGLRTTVTNNALTIVFNALAVEGQYHKAQETIGQAVLDARSKLRVAENACWNMIIPKVQERAAQDTSGAVTLVIATSTQFSDAVIRTQLQPLADAARQGIDNSDQALAALKTLAASLQNTASLSVQNVALHQLDNLLANHTVHTQFDLKTVQGQADTVQTAMTNLVTDTVKSWGDNPANPPGWCNVNKVEVIDFWLAQWKK